MMVLAAFGKASAVRTDDGCWSCPPDCCCKLPEGPGLFFEGLVESS